MNDLSKGIVNDAVRSAEVSRNPEVDQNSPYYELSKQVVDELQAAGVINLLNYPAAINTTIKLLDRRKVVITQR